MIGTFLYLATMGLLGYVSGKYVAAALLDKRYDMAVSLTVVFLIAATALYVAALQGVFSIFDVVFQWN